MEMREFLSHFEVVRRNHDDSFQARCPGPSHLHGDRNPSLTITEADGKILMHCHAGCEPEEILEAVGLTMQDLIIKPSAEEDFGNNPKWMQNLEKIYDYYDDDGEYAYSKLRYAGKKILYGYIEKNQCSYKVPGKERYLYNLKDLKEAIAEGKPVYIVEGEKDVDTMRGLGLVATTAGSAGDWKKKFAKYFKGAWVTVLPDNDAQGQKMADRVENDIKDLCNCYRVITVSEEEKGDVTDYLQAGHSKEDLLALIDAEPWITGGGKARREIESYTAQDLIRTEFPDIFFIVNDLLAVGSAILAAPAKTGKSWMMLQLAIAAAEGGYFLGHKVNQCEVVYFALEDSPRRLKDRLKKQLAGKPAPEGITFITEAPTIEDGLLVEIEKMITDNPKIKLVIIDTLQKVKPPSSKTQTPYEQDYRLLGDVTDLARRKDFCFLFIHHLKKSNGFQVDPFEKILGSTALQGSTDTMAVMEREKRTEDGAVLHITGRDIHPQDLALTFRDYRWESLGDAGSIEQMRLEQAYRNHPAIITLKKKLEEIENNPDEPIKEYVVRAKDFRADVAKEVGETIGTNEKNFMKIVGDFDVFLIEDGIEHIEPKERTTTTHKGKRGRFHRYHYTKKIQ